VTDKEIDGGSAYGPVRDELGNSIRSLTDISPIRHSYAGRFACGSMAADSSIREFENRWDLLGAPKK
jgi:hypothetical protein